MSIETVADHVRQRLPELAPLNARVKFAVEPAGSVVVDATATPPRLIVGDEDADCTIHVGEDNFHKLIDGSLNPTLAYTLGQIRVEGSLGVAMKLASLLDQ